MCVDWRKGERMDRQVKQGCNLPPVMMLQNLSLRCVS
uniref:Uncharacterized protein n=1 Tax=Arundo donax TaxID=35708 RepID=A0A0A9EP88_ARUDO